MTSLDDPAASIYIHSPMDWITNPEAWIALLTLTALEIVLGIDNIIFISILSSRLPREEQARARSLGLIAALVSRILLLCSLSYVMKLTTPVIPPIGPMTKGLTGRDLILLFGGLFLIGKATWEIHHKLEGAEEEAGTPKKKVSFGSVIIQVLILDVVFSLDSVITAVGMADQIGVMVTAVIISVGIMLWAAGPISTFVERHPTLKVLALSFLILIGVALAGEGLGHHIPKGYIYFSMAFALCVELVNLRVGRRKDPAPVLP